MNLKSNRDDSERLAELESLVAELRASRVNEAAEVYQSIFEIMPGGIVHISNEGAILKANREAQRLLGYSYDELTDRYTADWAPETIREDGSPFPLEEYPASLALATGEPQGPVTIGVKRPDGRLFWAVFRAMPVKDAQTGAVSGAVVTFMDITAERERIEELSRGKKEMKALLSNIPHYIVNYDRDGRILFVNRVDSRTSMAEVLNSTVFDYYPESEHEAIRRRIERVIDSGDTVEFESIIEVNGKAIHLHNVLWRAFRDEQPCVGAISTDVTRLAQSNAELRHQATHDFLTRLSNRVQFERDVKQAITTARLEKRQHAICYLDLDQFKLVNDTCGHIAGDELLRQLSAELLRSLPDFAILARLGGDEFGVLFYDTSPEAALQQAHSILAIIEQFRFTWEERLFRIGVSIGLAHIDANCEGFTQLLKDADLACFIAKDSGRNQVHVFSPDNDRLNRRKGEMLTVNEISRAIEGDGFRLFFQKIDPLNGSTDGLSLEILLRLLNHRGETISPALFIPAAERYDIMHRIDRWVVRNTLDWLEKNPRISANIDFLSVNLSGKSLGDERFHRFCHGLFDAMAVPLEKLRFEITETAALSNPDLTRKFILDLRKLGIRFALDDFGSGFTSFQYLRNLPIDLLKIDGSFVRRIHQDRIDFSFVQSIHDLAQSMNLKTVAEFVENEDILRSVRTIGIDYAQGFYLHRPEPLNNLSR